MTRKQITRSNEESTPPAGPEERSSVGSAGGVLSRPDPEVLARARRRTFTAAYKLRILDEIDRSPGQGGTILRREGLYSSHLVDWRRARRAGALGALSKKRGPATTPGEPLKKEVERLERELARTKEDLRRAHLILDVQGKVAELLGFSLSDGKNS